MPAVLVTPVGLSTTPARSFILKVNPQPLDGLSASPLSTVELIKGPEIFPFVVLKLIANAFVAATSATVVTGGVPVVVACAELKKFNELKKLVFLCSYWAVVSPSFCVTIDFLSGPIISLTEI